MNKILIPILFVVFSAANCRAQINFAVPRGETIRGFAFAADGILKYRGKEFSPSVKFGAETKRLDVSFLPNKGLAGAIAVDEAENSFVLLDTKNAASRDCAEISSAAKMFWSPSRRYLVVYGEYEGARLYSINVSAKTVASDENWFPEHDLWVLNGKPKWSGKSEQIAFKVVAGCDPTADPSNPCEDKPEYFEVRVDAATMRLRNKKRISRFN